MSKTLRRGVVAMAAASLCLIATAIPAGAATTTITITSGNVLLAKTGQTTVSVPLGGTGTGTTVVDTVSTTSSTTGTVNITSLTTAGRTQTFGTTWYIAEITRTASTASTSNYHTNTATGSTITVNAQLWIATDQSTTSTSLAHGTSTADSGTTISDRRANWNTTIQNIAVSGYTGTAGNICDPGTSDTATINSTASTPLIGTSATPFAAYSLGNVTLSNVVIHAG